MCLIHGWLCKAPAALSNDQGVHDTRQQADIVKCMLILTVRRAHILRMLLKELL